MTTSQDDQVRVLHVVGGMNPGGIETWLMHILRSVDRSRYQMDFLVHATEPCAYDEEIRSLGSRIIPCPGASAPWVYARNFKQILQSYGTYDIIHSQQYLYSGFILRLAHQMGVPVRIAHMHPLTDICRSSLSRKLYTRLMTGWISSYSNCIIACSLTTLETFGKICDCRGKYTDVVYNCLDLERYRDCIDRDQVRRNYGLPVDKPVVIYVARLVPHKNHAQIFRIADAINKEKVKVHFAIVGSHGELLEDLRETVSKRRDTSVHIGVKDISGLLLASDLFFFPSLEEGFGVVAIEAAAAGLPVVATRLPTIEEACAASHRRFMFTPNDDAAATRNILEILNNEELKKQLALDSRDWASRFSISQSLDKLLSVYNTCIANETNRYSTTRHS